MKRKKGNIAIFHCGFIYSGGGERIVLEEALGLAKLGYNVEVFAPTQDVRKCYPQLLGKVRVRTFLPQLPSFVIGRYAILMIASSVFAPFFAPRFSHIDFFIGANQPGAWIAFCIATLLGKPYIVYLNQPNRLLYPRAIDRKVGWITSVADYHLLSKIIRFVRPFIVWTDRVSYASAKAMLVNGEFIKTSVERIYKTKTVSVPAGAYVYPHKRLFLNPHTAYVGEFFIKGIRIVKPYALITNRHDPQKRFDYVIFALKHVIYSFPNATLVIPGPFTNETAKLKTLAANLGVSEKVLFLGQVTEEDLQTLYRNATIYCYPSPEEDFGLGPLEAGGWGVPTVAWNFGGPTVTVINGVTGFLAKPYDINDYAAKMLSLFTQQDKRAAMGKAARQRTQRVFSWEHHVKCIDHLFQQYT